jgi:nitrogen fixation NifU-like protein
MIASDLRDLYQEVILDHSKNPRNRVFPEGSNKSGEGYNALCGDRLTLKLRVEGGVVRDVGFQGAGCAISTASASTMTEAIKGKTLDEVNALFHLFHEVVTGKEGAPDPESLGKLAVFAGVSTYPMRVKCATLAWHTLQAALEGKGEATTE